MKEEFHADYNRWVTQNDKLFPFEGVKLNLGKLAIWRIKSHETFGGTWLSDYVPNRLGGFLDEAPAQKTEEIQQPGEHPSHSAWEGEEAGLGGMSMKQWIGG